MYIVYFIIQFFLLLFTYLNIKFDSYCSHIIAERIKVLERTKQMPTQVQIGLLH